MNPTSSAPIPHRARHREALGPALLPPLFDSIRPFLRDERRNARTRRRWNHADTGPPLLRGYDIGPAKSS
jgi:hypothetical protein